MREILIGKGEFTCHCRRVDCHEIDEKYEQSYLFQRQFPPFRNLDEPRQNITL